ncbi:MAG: hypothetical protein MZU97_00775 [Bacillus subtilis]|nr:hypothetical protein [Bacillus subtilis]
MSRPKGQHPGRRRRLPRTLRMGWLHSNLGYVLADAAFIQRHRVGKHPLRKAHRNRRGMHRGREDRSPRTSSS